MKFISLIIIIALSIGCDKNYSTTSVPVCIQNKIEQIKSAPVHNPPSSVWQYTYKGNTVYFIPLYCCDVFSELYDSNCNLICNPNGGITGSGDGRCKDFFDERTDEKLIWEDPRK